MEIVEYYIKTLTAAGGKLLPVGVFLLVGYFLFIKLPFYFMVKVSKENKKTEAELAKDVAVEHKAPQQEKIKAESNNYQEKLNQAREEKEKQQKRRGEETKHKKKTEEPKKAAPPKNVPPEEIFEIPVGKVLSKSELKKRYFELLKMNHPDKVASLGNDFKILAEKKTKAINSAYDELKKKAS
jgi:hypothetical protein